MTSNKKHSPPCQPCPFVVGEEAGSGHVGVGGIHGQSVLPAYVVPGGMEGVAEGLLDALRRVQAVGDEELHALASGADEGQVGAEHAIGKQAVAPFLRLGGGVRHSSASAAVARWSMSMTKSPEGNVRHSSLQ